MNMRYLTLAPVLFIAMTTGCTSFSSTMLNRQDDNSLRGNSNGLSKLFKKTRPYKGLPITLKVPSHLDVKIKETYFLTMEGDRKEPEELLPETRILNVETKIIQSDKVFLVDFKRPGAGTLDLKLDFTDEQYFDQIDSKLVDRTIEDAGELAAQVIDSVTAIATASARSSSFSEGEVNILEENGIMKDTRTVAFKRFDINAIDFEMQVEEFVQHHLNLCNQCGTQPTYDLPL